MRRALPEELSDNFSCILITAVSYVGHSYPSWPEDADLF